jgi:hypothetical protein
MLDKDQNIKPDIDGEMDEIQRISQDLSRDEDINISVKDVVKSFQKSKEQTLSDDIWVKLENTESNEIEKGNIDSVDRIAKMYNKTNPKKLIKVLKSGEYKRPLILKLGERYILVAGNTRLCTASVLGMNPKVFIGKISMDTKLEEKWSDKYKKSIDCNNSKGFSQRAHCQGKKKKVQENEKLKGGLSDNMSLGDIAVKHKVDIDTLTREYIKGVKVEMEHTEDKNLAKEIAMDHLVEDPKYYTKLNKIETKESMGADAAGAFVGPAFGGVIKKKDIYKPNNFKKYNINEATDASSSGPYDAPFGDGGKNPLKINGEKSIKKSRAVKDKNFPKWGGPKGIFIKIKEKCKKYPYCNQGDINAIELLEIEGEIREISEKYGIPYKEMEKIVLNEINKIFISMKLSDINTLIENIASEEIKKTIVSESEGDKKQVYHIKLDGEPVETFDSKEEAEEALPKYQAKEKGELIIEPEIYESYEDMIEKLDNMGQELEEKENQNMENQEPMEGNEFTAALVKAKESGEKTFTVDGKEYDVQECWKQLEEEESKGEWDEEEECKECGEKSMEEKLHGGQVKLDKDKDGKITKKDFNMMRDMKEGKGICNECGSMLNEEGMCNECGIMKESTKKKKVLRLTESQMIDMIKKIVSESVPGMEVTKKAQSQSKKDNEANAKEVEDKIKKATTIEGSDNPEFPNQNNSGTKVARQNNEEENEFVEDNRGGTAINLDYDYAPSKKFTDRLKAALEGDSKMGNSQDAANVVKSDLGKKLAKKAERKEKKEEGAPMYNKDVQPVKEVNESEEKSSSILKEEIEKMKKMASYNKKTQ